MPSRSFYQVPDFKHVEELLLEAHGAEIWPKLTAFRQAGVAPLIDEGSLPRCIGIGTPLIFSILKQKHRHYRTFKLKKRSGKFRQITSPRTYLKVIQWWILDYILCHRPLPKFVTGFVKGQSPITNARIHFGNRHVLSMDLKEFFPSIEIERVHRIFEEMTYPSKVVEQLSQLVTLDMKLPQGAPTSPSIANLAARELDEALVKWSNERQMTYSRYADDLTFSCREGIGNDIPREIEQIVSGSGFEINTQKTRFSGPGDRIEVTGLVINEKVQRPRRWRNRTRAIFFQATKNPEHFRERLSELNGFRGALGECDGGEKLRAAADSAIAAVKQRIAREPE